MGQRICVEASYFAGTNAIVNLPEDLTWADVEDFYVKWDCLHFKVRGEWNELTLDSTTIDIIDWKRPTDVAVLAVDEDDVQTGEVLGEHG